MKHIKHIYIFVKDKVDQGDIEIVHSPEDRMWADVLTKPKSCRLFLEDRSILMNCPAYYMDNGESDKVSDEKNKPEEFTFVKVGGFHILCFTVAAGVC